MVAVDTNILVYAHRQDSPWHEAAYKELTKLVEGDAPWAIPWPCLHEFLNVLTNRRLYQPPTPMPEALNAAETVMQSVSLLLLSEGGRYFQELRSLVEEGQITGQQVHDARVAALCLAHGVTELWSADRDFSRFPRLKVRNPLVGR